MPHAASPSPSHARSRRLLHRGLLGLVYLTALSGLIVWEYRDRLTEFTAACEVESPSPRSELYAMPYRRMLAWASRDSAPHVAVIAIPEELESIQSNLCLARGYMADLLKAISAQHPAEVVLDKFYSPTACSNSAAEEAEAAELPRVIRSLPFPVVIGESTRISDAEKDGACLVTRPQLDFQAPNVRHGLTQLNIEYERIPLTWRVLPSADSGAASTPRDSLAWAAVQAYDPTYAQHSHLPSLAAVDNQPYARLHIDLPRETSTQLLCHAGDPATLQRWSVECPQAGNDPPPSLLGKIVVIGSEDERDRRLVLGASTWGFDLQARYMEDLLTGSYLRGIPILFDFILFATFVFIIEGMPTLLEAFRPEWGEKRFISAAFRRRRYAWVIFWAIAFMVVTTVLCLLIGFLPPLIVFGDIAFIAITRLLFFAAETFESPLVHSHTKGTTV